MTTELTYLTITQTGDIFGRCFGELSPAVFVCPFFGGNMNCPKCDSINILWDDYSEVKYNYIYCHQCNHLEVFEKKCEHDYVLLKRGILGGGSKMIKFCKSCYSYSNGGKIKDAPKNVKTIHYDEWNAFYEKLSEGIPGKMQYAYQLIKHLKTIYNIVTDYDIYSIRQKERDEAYKNYISGKEWAAKRKTAIERDNYKCQVCGYTKNLCVHHLTYQNVIYNDQTKTTIGNEYLFELITLCESCHINIYHPNQKNTTT